MDLSQLKEQRNDPIDVPLIFNEAGEPTDGFKVVGSNSEQYQKAERDWRLLNIRKSARQGTRASEVGTPEGAAELLDRVDQREAAIAQACIVGIYGFTIDGAPAPLNAETLKAIFDARPMWRTKVIATIESEQVFTNASSVPGAEKTTTPAKAAS